MKKWMSWLPMLALACLLAIGCGGKDEENESGNGDSDDSSSQTDGNGDSEVTEANFACTACGGEAAEGHKCAEGEICDKCGLGKETALCCKVTKDELASLEGKKLCLACGHVAEDGHKCDTSHDVCLKCNVHADSILCKCEKEEETQESDPDS